VFKIHLSKQNLEKRDNHENVQKGQHLQDPFEAMPSRHLNILNMHMKVEEALL
jgi:hypothetical protein